MICPVCKKRYADFPKEDFILTDYGFEPKNDLAEKTRKMVFDANNEEICLDCKEEGVRK